MPSRPVALLDLKTFSHENVQALFSLAKKLKSRPGAVSLTGETLALLFFEPSTRTRLSFETAAHRVGLHPMLLDGGAKSSLEKGESLEDSILNVAAMGPRFLVIRSGETLDLQRMTTKVDIPIVNAGWGVKGHPTQALLDTFTLAEDWGSLKGKKILFVGDILHSRVVASHMELLPALGAEMGFCAPKIFLSEASAKAKIFTKLSQGLEWADAVMALRCQFERHDNLSLSRETYHEEYGLTPERLKAFAKKGLILHPGPVNHGVEMASEVLEDPRCRVLSQVKNGVFVREALLRWMMGESA